MNTPGGSAMQGIAAITTGLLVLASFAVGARLVVLHRRTGGAPELLLGGMLLLTVGIGYPLMIAGAQVPSAVAVRCRSEEHTSELQSLRHLVCRLLLEKKKTH